MRLLHLIGTLDPAAGGVSESVRMLIKHSPATCTYEVVTLDDPHALFLRDLTYPVHALGPQHNVYGSNSKLVPWLRANRHRFDGVIVNGLWQSLGKAALQALGGHTPYIVITHGMIDPYFKRKYPLKHLKKWVYWLLAEYWVLRGAHRVLFTTEEESRLATQSFWLHQWTPAVVSYGASQPEGVSPDVQRNAFFAACPLLRRKRFVLFLGRIHRKKGCDMLVDAFAKLAASDPELHLVMAGPDQQQWTEALRQKGMDAGVGDRIHWTGMLHGNAKWGAYFASEVFILPSHQENFGIAVAEALACGRPVLLAKPVNIAPEVLEDGAALVEADTPDGTQRLLSRWISMPSAERTEMAVRARACFDRRYNMWNNAAAICRLFESARPAKDRQLPDSTGNEEQLLGTDAAGVAFSGLMRQRAGVLRP